MKAHQYTIFNVSLPNEKHLLLQIAQDDEHAFRQLFEAYRKPVYSYIVYLIKSEVLADEILQDVFLKIWLSRNDLTEIKSFQAWLYTITRNKILDTLRVQAKEILIKQAVPDITPAYEMEDKLRETEYAALLHNAISQLSPKQQQVYQLSRENGLKINEIAVELNISSSTVKTHLMQALRTIKKHLQPHLHTIITGLLFLRWL